MWANDGTHISYHSSHTVTFKENLNNIHNTAELISELIHLSSNRKMNCKYLENSMIICVVLQAKMPNISLFQILSVSSGSGP